MPLALSVEFGCVDEMWGLLLAAPRKCTLGFNSGVDGRQQFPSEQRKKIIQQSRHFSSWVICWERNDQIDKDVAWFEGDNYFLSAGGEEPKRCKGRLSTWTPGLCSWLGFVTLGKTFWAWAKVCFGLSSFLNLPLFSYLYSVFKNRKGFLYLCERHSDAQTQAERASARGDYKARAPFPFLSKDLIPENADKPLLFCLLNLISPQLN